MLSQNYDFHLNFQGLREEKGMTQKEFADFLGIATGAVGGYENRTRTPNTKQLLNICQKCNVSADYLLGLEEITKPDNELKFVCEYTGLSERAVVILHNRFHFNFFAGDFDINSFLEHYPEEDIATDSNDLISLIIEENDCEIITDYEGESKVFDSDREEKPAYPAIPVNPKDKKPIYEHASNLFDLIEQFISFPIPNNRYLCVGEDYNDISINDYVNKDIDELAYTSFAYKSRSAAYQLNKVVESGLFDEIKEELKKLRNTYKSRSAGAVNNDSAKGE